MHARAIRAAQQRQNITCQNPESLDIALSRAEWESRVDKVKLGKDFREAVLGVFYYAPSTLEDQDYSFLKGAVWYGPCKTYPAFSGETVEFYDMVFEPEAWELAQPAVRTLSEVFNKMGFKEYMVSKPQFAEPRSEKFYAGLRARIEQEGAGNVINLPKTKGRAAEYAIYIGEELRQPF